MKKIQASIVLCTYFKCETFYEQRKKKQTNNQIDL